MSNLTAMLTVGVIARKLGQSIHKIEYVIKSRQIAAIGAAGNARVYSEEAVDTIAQELRRIGSARATRSRAAVSLAG
jgi:hypothetical protein